MEWESSNILLNSASIAAGDSSLPSLAPPLSPLRSVVIESAQQKPFVATNPTTMTLHPIDEHTSSAALAGIQYSPPVSLVPHTYPIPITIASSSSHLYSDSSSIPSTHQSHGLHSSLQMASNSASNCAAVSNHNLKNACDVFQVSTADMDNSGLQNSLLQATVSIPSGLHVFRPTVIDSMSTVDQAVTITSLHSAVPRPSDINSLSRDTDVNPTFSPIISYPVASVIPLLSTANATVFPVSISSSDNGIGIDNTQYSYSISPDSSLVPSMTTGIITNISTCKDPSQQLKPPSSLGTLPSLSTSESATSMKSTRCFTSINMNFTPLKSSTNGCTYPRPTLCYTRILLGEITSLLAAMRRATPRWSQHQAVSNLI